jgi:hypothetical protein
MLIHIADRRKPTPFILEKKRISQQNFLFELELNATRQGE